MSILCINCKYKFFTLHTSGLDSLGAFLFVPFPETNALGVNMVEYVLGGSPTGKDMDNRLRMKGFVSGPENNVI